MPKPKPKNQPAAAPSNNERTAVANAAGPRPVKYPELEIHIFTGQDALTCDQMKRLLGWEADGTQDEAGNEIHVTESAPAGLKDAHGRRVRCLNNLNNRPYYADTAGAYAQDILNRRWADSRNGGTVTLPVLLRDAEGNFDPEGRTEEQELPEITLNGETLIFDRYGDVDSGQHRGIGFIRACELWAGAKDNGGDQSAHWLEKWPEEPTLECIIVFGVSADPRVKRTLDNVRTRTFADVLTTEGIFPGRPAGERAKLCRSYDYAVRLLWERTGAKKDAYSPYRTHGEALDWGRRHPSLEAAVLHVAERGKAPPKREGDVAAPRGSYALLGLGHGDCAALLYLMGTSASDPDVYYDDRRDPEPRGEGVLDLSHWDKALAFWAELAKGERGKLCRVAEAIAAVHGPESAQPVTRAERLAVVCRAWVAWLADKNLARKDQADKYLSLEDYLSAATTTTDEEGNEVPEPRALVATPSVSGIDLAGAAKEEEADEDGAGEESEEVAAEEPSAPKSKPRPPAPPPKPLTLEEELRAVQQDYPGKLVLFRDENTVNVWGGHAVTVARALGLKTTKHPDGIARLKFPASDLSRYLGVLSKGNHPVQVVVQRGAAQAADAATSPVENGESARTPLDAEDLAGIKAGAAEELGRRQTAERKANRKANREADRKPKPTKAATTSRGNR